MILFYAPKGARPRRIPTAWKHPRTGAEYHHLNAPIPELDILPLHREVPRPDTTWQIARDEYVRNEDGTAVIMSWRVDPKDIVQELNKKLAALDERTRLEGEKAALATGFDKRALDLALVYAHGAGGPWQLFQTNGSWVSLTDAEIATLVSKYADAQNAILTIARTHSEKLRAYAAARDVKSIVKYDVSTGW